MFQAPKQIKIVPFSCTLQELTCKSWWRGKALKTSSGKLLSLDQEMNRLTFVPALDPPRTEKAS